MKPQWLLLAALALAGCAKKLAPDDAARRFFDLIAAGKAPEAYAESAFAFRSQQTVNFFQTTLHELGLDEIASSKFDAPQLSSDGRSARVEAELATKAKTIVPFVVSLVNEDGKWKVLSVKSPRDPSSGKVESRFTTVGRDPGFGDPTAVHEAPDAATVKALTRKALLTFNDAVKQQNFVPLFNECSLHWQDQLVTREGAAAIPGTMKRDLTPKERELGAARLQHAFDSFIEQRIDIGGIDGVEPIFDRAPWVNTDGLLIVAGHYPTTPYRVNFALKFYFEVPVWRLFGLDVNVKKADVK